MWRLAAGVLFAQDRASDWIGPEGGATFQLLVVGEIVDALEVIEWLALRQPGMTGNIAH